MAALPPYEVVQSRELTDADRAAGILSDPIVRIGQRGKPGSRPDHRVPTAGWSRLVCVKRSPHTSRGKYKGASTGPDSEDELLAHLAKRKRQDEAPSKN